MLPCQLKRFLPQTFKHLPGLQGFRHSSSKANSLYEVLGVERTCSQAHIKVAFYRQAKLMHPDVQGAEERELEAEAFIRLAAAYEVLRDPDRRANYDAHLSSRSKIVGSAFDFDPDTPSREPPWPDMEPMGDQHVAPWVRQYRQAVREVVRYGGDGDGLVHRVKVEFGEAVRQAYFGPEVAGLVFGDWPMEFEGEERSIPRIGDVMHLVSGRQLLGTVREARDILLERGENALGRSALGTGAPGSARATIETTCEASYEYGLVDRGRKGGRLGSKSEAGEGASVEGAGPDLPVERGLRKLPVEDGAVNRSWDGRNTEGQTGESSELSESYTSRSEGRRERSHEGCGLRKDHLTEEGKERNADGKPRGAERNNEGVSDGGRFENGNGPTGDDFAGSSITNGLPDSGNGLEDGVGGSFATLELTQQGEVVGVATREWVPLTESGNGNGNGSDETERMDCISIYAVNRGEWSESEGVSERFGGFSGGFGGFSKGAGGFSEGFGGVSAQEASSREGCEYVRQQSAGDGSTSGNRNGTTDEDGRDSRNTSTSASSKQGRVGEDGDGNGSRNEKGHGDGKGGGIRGGTGHGNRFGSGSGSGNGNGNGSGEEKKNGNSHGCENGHRQQDGTGLGHENGIRNGNGSGGGNGNGNGKATGDGWAEDVERLGLRYGRPRLLARLFGLRDGRASIEVFQGGGSKTHTLLQHRTPLVRHVAWYRSDVDKRGRRVRKCEARLRRATMLPSSLWLFEPRATTHDCGGWYFERFDDEEPRGASSLARLQPLTSDRFLDDQLRRERHFARDAYQSGEPVAVQTSHTGRGSSDTGGGSRDRGCIRQQSNHRLRFEWPSSNGENELYSKHPSGEPKPHMHDTKHKPAVVPPLDPAVYILTAAYLTLDKEVENQTAKPSAVAGLFEKGAKWTGEIKSWWQSKAGV